MVLVGVSFETLVEKHGMSADVIIINQNKGPKKRHTEKSHVYLFPQMVTSDEDVLLHPRSVFK